MSTYFLHTHQNNNFKRRKIYYKEPTGTEPDTYPQTAASHLRGAGEAVPSAEKGDREFLCPSGPGLSPPGANCFQASCIQQTPVIKPRRPGTFSFFPGILELCPEAFGIPPTDQVQGVPTGPCKRCECSHCGHSGWPRPGSALGLREPQSASHLPFWGAEIGSDTP